MVWGGITYRGSTDLYVIQNNLNTKRYCNKIFSYIVIPFLNHQGNRELTFQKDNARPHTARIGMDIL